VIYRAARGFTLIELCAALTILALLALGAVPMIKVEAQRSKERELRGTLFEIRQALDAYKRASDDGRIAKAADGTGYPPNLTVLAQGIDDVKTPGGPKMYFLRRVPRDPMAPPELVPNERTWGYRSYASRPEAPAPGKDVFDVFSLSTGVGLNGVEYRRW
jgi:general secretion pathway protein G